MAWRDNYRNYLKDAIIGISLALLCVVIQQSSKVFGNIIKDPVPFSQVSQGVWQGDTSGLVKGEYFISVGAPREICDIKLDGNVVGTNRGGIPGIRNTIFLGGAFQLLEHSPTLAIECENTTGFRGLAYEPIVTQHSLGVFLHIWRQLTDMLLAPVASIIAIFSFLAIGAMKFHARSREDQSIVDSPFE